MEEETLDELKTDTCEGCNAKCFAWEFNLCEVCYYRTLPRGMRATGWKEDEPY